MKTAYIVESKSTLAPALQATYTAYCKLYGFEARFYTDVRIAQEAVKSCETEHVIAVGVSNLPEAINWRRELSERGSVRVIVSTGHSADDVELFEHEHLLTKPFDPNTFPQAFLGMSREEYQTAAANEVSQSQ